MDQLVRMLLQASLWARRRPPREFVYALVGVTILVAMVFGLDALGWWPEWATVENGHPLPKVLPHLP